jgi:hypothetical protein
MRFTSNGTILTVFVTSPTDTVTLSEVLRVNVNTMGRSLSTVDPKSVPPPFPD